MPSVARHLRKLCILGLLASPAYAADDWQAVTFISATVGNHSNRLCMGVPDHMRGSDIGCPTYAPSLTTGGHVSITGNVSANRFIGDGSGLTNLNVQGDRIVSGTHAAVANEQSGIISLTTGANTWGYLSAGWSRLANLFANTVSSTLVSATHVSATYVDTTRGGTVSGTYGYFHHISGTDVHGRFTGDGSGLTGVTAAASDRIVSGSTGGTRMVAISSTGFISITQAGANSGWFDPTRGLVTLGVSATGAISGTRGYFRETVGIGTLAPVGALHIAGLSHSRSVRLSSDLGAYTELGILNNTASWFDVNPHPLTASENSTIRFFRHVSTTGVAEVIFHRADGGGDPVAVIGNTRIALGMNGINVGIGLWGTGARLGVAGTISATDAIQVGSSSLTCGAGIAGALRYSGSKIEYCNGTAWGALVGAAEAMGDRIVSGSTSILAHQDRSLTFTTAGTQRMVIGADGNIGIGTDAPQTNLHVAGSMFVAGSGSGIETYSSGIGIGKGGGGIETMPSIRAVQMSGDNDIQGLAFFSKQSGTHTDASVERMRISHLGNVGIGITAPSATLHISGSIRIAGTGAETCNANMVGGMRRNPGTGLMELCQ